MKISFAPLAGFLQALREHPLGQKIILLFGGILLLWGISFVYLLPLCREEAERESYLHQRTFLLAHALKEYKNLEGTSGRSKKAPLSQEPLEALNAVLESLNFQSRVSQLTASGERISFTLENLGGEELLTLLQELRAKGLGVESAELHTSDSGKKKNTQYTLLLSVQGRDTL